MLEFTAALVDGRRRRERLPERPDGSPNGSPMPFYPPPPRPRFRDRNYRERLHDQDGRRRRSPPSPFSPPPPLLGPSREREYRRRRSPSPPPYRDRRPSPPCRSPSPVSYKRSRRDDGGYNRRPGSYKGCYGAEGRRYDYDYDYGRYERGGRGCYCDERSYGRHMNRSSNDWFDSGRGGFGDDSSGNGRREGLMSYKQFIQGLEDDVLPAEAAQRLRGETRGARSKPMPYFKLLYI